MRFGIERLETRQLLTVVVVDTIEDIVDDNDPWTSLREAVHVANESLDLDEIHFDDSLSGGTITLLHGELELKRSQKVKIIGPGADLLTIDASGSDPTPDLGDGSRIFNFLNGEIEGLTLTGGDAPRFPGGGAIVSDDDLIVRDMIFRENYSSQEAGAIRVFGNLRVYDSWFDQNSAFDDGGAIYGTRGSIVVEGSAFTGNFTDGSRGGDGGAIAARTTVGEFVVSNSTFSGNQIRSSGRGGAIDYAGFVHGLIVNSTIVNNSSGFAPGLSIRDGSFDLRNTVIANNVGGNEGDLYLDVFEVSAEGVLFGNAADLIIEDSPTVYFGRADNPLDPDLSPLIVDGNSFPYHKPLPGSPIIDKGVSNVGVERREYDQRGMPHWRAIGTLDIGAIEHLGAGDTNTNEIADVADIDSVCVAIRDQSPDLSFDLNGDQVVDLLDLDWLTGRWYTGPGDINLDRQFNTADLVGVFTAAEYRDDLPNNSLWSTGDWNCDGEFDTSDLVVAFQAAWFENGRVLNAVVEDSDVAAATLGFADVAESEDRLNRRRNIAK